jgi:hypothetical protein
MKTLKEAQDEMIGKMVKGTKCQCCGQNVKLNKVSLTKAMTGSLVWMSGKAGPGNNWVDVPEVYISDCIEGFDIRRTA